MSNYRTIHPIIPRRSKPITALAALRRLRSLTPAAIKVLKMCLADAENPQARPAALAAAKLILDKGWGDEFLANTGRTAVREIPFRDLSTPELEAMAQRFFHRDQDVRPMDLLAGPSPAAPARPEDF